MEQEDNGARHTRKHQRHVLTKAPVRRVAAGTKGRCSFKEDTTPTSSTRPCREGTRRDYEQEDTSLLSSKLAIALMGWTCLWAPVRLESRQPCAWLRR